jgi:hypothetical protein
MSSGDVTSAYTLPNTVLTHHQIILPILLNLVFDMLSNEALDVSSLEQLETYIQNKVKYINYFVVPSNLFECALDVTLRLFPTWKKEDLELEQCKDGITNKRK